MARVLIIGVTHCPGMRRGYVEFLKRVADTYAINRVVHIGDLVDWASISYHEKSPSLSNATDEYAKARRQIAALATALPKVDWLISNHDALTERQAITAGLLAPVPPGRERCRVPYRPTGRQPGPDGDLGAGRRKGTQVAILSTVCCACPVFRIPGTGRPIGHKPVILLGATATGLRNKTVTVAEQMSQSAAAPARTV